LPHIRGECCFVRLAVVVGVFVAFTVGHCFPSVTVLLCPVGGAD
jgi:hypothetical protein